MELHVEQGPVLERAGVPIGIVTGIFGQIRLSVRFEGRADHAGTTPMTMRADAYAAAAEFSHQFRRAVLDLGEGVAVGTIGLVRVEPNAGNVVPSRVRLGLEIRDINPDRLERLGGEVRRLAESAATDGVTVSLRTIHEAPPTPLDAALCDRFAAAAETSGVAALRLPSGAGHDVQPMSALTRTGLIFVPSVGGRSHCPEEDTDWADIEAGAAVLEATARDLVEGR
ncbi:MAG: M20/M25/M40 family metallo-hydrolase [Hyphomicrobiales bacterium]